MRYRYRLQVPLVGGKPKAPAAQKNTPLGHALRGTLTQSDHRRLITEWNKQTDPYVVLKPVGSLGAPWISDLVALKKSVTLCETCVRKYWKWWERYDYRPIWSPKELTDCTGCRSTLTYCTGFYFWKQKTPWAISIH